MCAAGGAGDDATRSERVDAPALAIQARQNVIWAQGIFLGLLLEIFRLVNCMENNFWGPGKVSGCPNPKHGGVRPPLPVGEFPSAHWQITPSVVQLAAIIRVKDNQRIPIHAFLMQGVQHFTDGVIERHNHPAHDPAAVVHHLRELVDERLRGLVGAMRRLQRQIQIQRGGGVMLADYPRGLPAVEHRRVRAVVRRGVGRAGGHDGLALSIIVDVNAKNSRSSLTTGVSVDAV